MNRLKLWWGSLAVNWRRGGSSRGKQGSGSPQVSVRPPSAPHSAWGGTAQWQPPPTPNPKVRFVLYIWDISQNRSSDHIVICSTCCTCYKINHMYPINHIDIYFLSNWHKIEISQIPIECKNFKKKNIGNIKVLSSDHNKMFVFFKSSLQSVSSYQINPIKCLLNVHDCSSNGILNHHIDSEMLFNVLQECILRMWIF